MCLATQYTKARRKEYLKRKTGDITAYKIVYESMKHKTLIPVFMTRKPYTRITPNKLVFKEIVTIKDAKEVEYKAGYHLFLTKHGAIKWAEKYVYPSMNDVIKIFKCKIPKKAVLAVGRQKGWTAIVTKEFSFDEENGTMLGK